MKRTLLENRAIILLLAAGLVLGLLTFRFYGESWDEQQFFKYADRALEAYSTWPRTGSVALTGNTYDNYGPAYVMFVALGARLLGRVVPLMTSDLRHLVYLLTYLVGVWAFCKLCLRWLSPNAALGATLLFATQPLFWGHAFISPKDIPFLTLFLLTILIGFRMTDSVRPISFDSIEPRTKRILFLITGAWIIAAIAALVATPLVHSWIENLAVAAQHTAAGLAAGSGTADQDAGARRDFVLFLRLSAMAIAFSMALVAWLWRRVPSAFQFVLSIAPAAALLGLTTSVRILGPFAGLMVAAYAVWTLRGKALLVLLAYGLIAAAAMYLTWPYLWPDPIGHLIESARVMSDYPWRGGVLFDGAVYGSTDLPRSYLPVLLAIQLTEPVWLLFAAGFAMLIYDARVKRLSGNAPLIVALAWFLLPLLGFIFTRSPLYDNFRQVIFILPPVFIVAGIVFEKIRHSWLQGAFIALVVLPGIVAGARLHPYEYIYYNRFIGGVQGAFRKYELDYWGTSYREAAAYLNSTAPANASVWVEGPTHLLQVYIRPDLKIYSTYEAKRAAHYDYIVALTRLNLDLQSYPDAPIDHVIEREGALLTVIKKP
jgi:hypothetical protein